jgi:glycosyltransferase involved in cell wall biosynthesis
MINFLVIIPAFNAEKEIEKTLNRVFSIIRDPRKIVLIDDGSEDATSSIAKKRGVVLLQHKENCGKGFALKTGFNYAIQHNIQWVFTLDADNQHDPTQIPIFLEKLQKNPVDLLIGKRRIQIKNMPFDRYLSNQLTSLMLSVVCGYRIHDSQCGFRLINLEFFKRIDLVSNRFETESELLIKYIKMGAKIVQVPIATIYAQEDSSIHRISDTYRFLKMFTRQI